MRGLCVKSVICGALFLSAFPHSGQSEVILQYFETRWDEMYQRLPEMAEIGYESIWTPPPGKSPIGGPYPYAYGGNVGYNSFDRFDLGDTPQRGHWETRYGSRTSLRNLVDNAHQLDMKIYPDIVFNHTGNGPDFRTYPGMVPQDFHVWADASQPGSFKRADRMWQWDSNNGIGGTLHQELVSLMDIVLEFDNRFQVGGSNSVGYVADPAPFVRQAGDYDKYPYHNVGDALPTETSRQFIVRWINWLGYAMDYDGVRLDAPKHVYKDFFGLPNQAESLRNQTFTYNIQRNLKERRQNRTKNTSVAGMNFDDMYQNDIRRDSALIFSEFFIGSVGEVDYWRNPADRNSGIQTRYLDFPRKKGIMTDAFQGGNLAALAGFTGFDPTEGVMFAHSHDEGPPSKLELAYAYILTHIGVPVVYFSGNNLAQSQIGRTAGKNTWMEKGYDFALGDAVNGSSNGAIPNLIYIHNHFARGKEYTRWSEGDYFAFERYDDLNGNGNPDLGEGLMLVALNDSGSDLTKGPIQTAFSPGTKLKDYTGRNADVVTVNGSGQVTVRVPGWWGQGFVCYAPFNAEPPASTDPLQFSGSGVSTISWVIPGGRDGAAKPARNIVRLTGDTVQIDVRYSNTNPQQNGETVDNVLLKWGQGRDLNGNGIVDNDGKSVVTGGFENMTKINDGNYRLSANIANIPEGLHVIKARTFNGRVGKPALFQTWSETVYVDRRGPDLEFENLTSDETIHGARVITINNPDRTLYNLTYKIDGGSDQQADQVIKGKWRISLSGLSAENHSITLNATEADYGLNRSVINTSTLTRSFTIDTAGSSIAMNHVNNATINEPFFKTTITTPAGTSASNVKLYWNGFEQLAPTETSPGSGVFDFTFTGGYRQGGVDKLFTGAFVNGPHFFEAVVNPGTANENRVSRRVVFNLFGQNMHDSDGDGLPDEIELSGFLDGTNPGPDVQWPWDNSKDLIPNFGESWSRLNAMAADTYYNGTLDGNRDTDGDGTTNLQEVIKGFRISGNPYSFSIYNASSTPPSTIGSYATSALTMSGGNKIMTITYRPNDGPLANASAVTVYLTPVGGGTPQTVAMTGGPTEFTYSYTVPSSTTAVNYTFTSGGTSDNTGGAGWSASTSAAFVMDGQFDSQNFVVSDNGMRIYAAIRGNKLYTATWSTKGGSSDHFIFITDQFGNPVTHPWAKAGKVYGKFDFTAQTKPWIGANPDNAYANGFGAAGRNWLGDQGKALETEIDLVQVFGSIPRILYIAVGAYPRANGGALLSQAPASFDNVADDIEIPEFQPVNTASIRDEDLDGKFDVGAPEMLVSVNGNETDGNYGLRRFYLDEVAGDATELTVKFKPNAAGAVSDVEVFTNLNRRDNAVLEENPSTVTSSSNTYFRAYPMSGPNADGYYTCTLPVNLCGAYRLQVRYKVSGVNGGNYIYYTDNALRRDCAIVVSPKKALTLNMYEVNPLIVEAKDTTVNGRSTFLDLVNDPSIEGEANGYDGRPDALNKDHYAALGVNMLWLQPIHPIGIEGRDINPETSAAFDPGSPYAVRDYWKVAPMLGRSNNESNAMSEFQTFVQRLDSWGVGVMMDGTFNHSSPDAIIGQGAVDLGITADGTQQIRAFNPGWYAKEGSPATPAANAAEIAIAPDRNDFGNWTDVREFYFGDYDALVKEKGTQNADKSYPDNAYKLAFLLERDEFAGHTDTTRRVWDYFAYYPIYWLEKSGHTSSTPKNQSHIGIDGLRCDFAQGLPSRFWEYAINKTRARKWDFIFMAESLDGAREVAGSKRHGVGYRSARHFDVLNENIVFYWRDTFYGYPANGGAGEIKNPKTYDTWKAYDDRRNAFDNVTLLNNLTSHDEVFPHNDVWSIAYGYAQVGALDGIPMLMYGQEAGAQNSKTAYGASEAIFGTIDPRNTFAKYEANFGKNIPNFKVYNNMASIWNNRTADEWKLQAFYGRVNKARLAAPALQSQNVYFLSKKQVGGGYDDGIFAVGKVQDLGQTGGGNGNSVVFAFVKNNPRVTTAASATFDLNAKVPGTDLNYFGIDRARNYNVKDLLADNSGAYVWPTNRTGADLIDNGLFVGLPNTTAATGSYQAQYLQLVDVSAPSLSFAPPQFMTYGTTSILTSSTTPASTVTYSLVGGDMDKVSLNGNQLAINSGTGSVTIRATVTATADRGGATVDATITFQKASQTITFDPTSTAGVVGVSPRTLVASSSSGLDISYSSGNPDVASLIRNALYFNSPGSATITASRGGNDNYEAATSVVRTYTVFGNGDDDGDGQTNSDEIIAGTDPLNPSSRFQINTILSSGSGFTLTWTAVPGRTYIVQAREDLSSGRWEEITTGLTNDTEVPQTLSYTDSVISPSRKFYRLVVQ